MKVQKEVRFQPVIIILETPEEVEHALNMCELCSESLGKDSFSQFCRNLRNRIRDAMGGGKLTQKKRT